MQKLTDSEKASLLALAKQYEYQFKRGLPNYQEIEFHIHRCLARGQEPIKIQPEQPKRKVDMDYYRYLSQKCMNHGYTRNICGRFSIAEMEQFLKQNKIPFELHYKFMRRDYRSYRECTTTYQQLLFRAKEKGYEKITKGRPSLLALYDFLNEF